MSNFDIITLIGALCGIIMVLGGIILLGIGAIKLAEAANGGNFTVEYKNELRITTSYPALGIFIIGLLFVILACMFAKPEKIEPVDILGQLNVDNPNSVRVEVEPDMVISDSPDSTGKFDKTLYPEIQKVRLTIVASGYKPEKRDFILDVVKGVIRIPNSLQFTKVVDMPLTLIYVLQ